jgi:hypothetical protein
MNPDPLARYIQRLPALITFFFSVMLVTFFRELMVTFNLSTNPTFDWSTPGHALIIVSFVATLFFVVAVWLSYSLLIERFPYTLDYSVFLFDVARFSVLYLIFSFSFLAGHPPDYWYFMLGLAVFHAMMAGWHGYRLRRIQGSERSERAADVRGHLLRAGTYFLLAVIYIVAVTLRWQDAQPWTIHSALVIVTCVLLVFWNARRLNEMKAKALQAQTAAKQQQAAAAAK